MRSLLLAIMAMNFVLAASALATLPDCPTEDSNWCVWHADRQGNGQGSSFVVLGGLVLGL